MVRQWSQIRGCAVQPSRGKAEAIIEKFSSNRSRTSVGQKRGAKASASPLFFIGLARDIMNALAARGFWDLNLANGVVHPRMW